MHRYACSCETQSNMAVQLSAANAQTQEAAEDLARLEAILARLLASDTVAALTANMFDEVTTRKLTSEPVRMRPNAYAYAHAGNL